MAVSLGMLSGAEGCRDGELSFGVLGFPGVWVSWGVGECRERELSFGVPGSLSVLEAGGCSDGELSFGGSRGLSVLGMQWMQW